MDITLGNRTFAFEDRGIMKLDLLCDRVTKEHPKQDSSIGIDGKTGSGKTDLAVVIAGYVKQKTGRDIHLFFTTQSTLRFAQRTERQLIILDEPSLDFLSKDWATTGAKDFFRLLNTMRRKRHFFIVNFANFWNFPQQLVIDRLNGLFHLYLKANGMPGKFLYIRQKNLEDLWNDYKKLNKRNFFKYKSFRGDFPYILEDGTFELLDITVEDTPHATYQDYEQLKDDSIKSIGVEAKKSKKFLKIELELRELKRRIATIDIKNIKTKQELAFAIGIAPRNVQMWAKNPVYTPNFLEKEAFEEDDDANINTIGETQPHAPAQPLDSSNNGEEFDNSDEENDENELTAEESSQKMK